MQFGVGPELAAQCPRVPSPDGYRAWTEADGPVPDALAKRAQALVDDQTVPLGTTESYPLPGVTALVRLEPRVWGRDGSGNFVQGCFRAAGVFLPSEAPEGAGVTPPSSKLERTIGFLTAGSLVVGIIATVATWGK